MKINAVKDMLNIISKIIPNETGCKIWPMGINSSGYGHYSIKNKSFNVSRLLYITLFPGEYKNLVVRHKCDNRSCCNIEHLEIGTQKDNIQDASKRKRLIFGEKNNMSRLTESLVIYCRESYPKKSTWELSKELGVNHVNIAKAINGTTWPHISGKKEIIKKNSAKGIKHHKSKLTESQVLEIRSKYPNKKGVELSKEYNVSHGLIYSILNKKIWRHI